MARQELLPDQHLTCARARRELDRIRAVTLDTGGLTIDVVTLPTPVQARILHTLGVDTHSWVRPNIT